MSECDEVAETMRPSFPRGMSWHEARAFVRRRMPDESPQVIDNVAESLLQLTGAAK